MKKLFFIILVFGLLLFAVGKAADVDVGGAFVQPGNPAGVISGFYRLALAMAGLLAFGAVVLGAIQYALAAGNPTKQSNARDTILQALLGLLLLFGAYLILTTINPGLKNLSLPTLSAPTVPAGFSSSPSSGASQRAQQYKCPYQSGLGTFSNLSQCNAVCDAKNCAAVQ